MIMARLPRAELLELFLQEFSSYLPEIRQGLAVLAVDSMATATLAEVHRLFHNIKGAAAQVQLDDLSRSARVVETVLFDLVEAGKPAPSQLVQALAETVDLLETFVGREHSEHDDDDTLSSRITALFANFGKEDTGLVADEAAGWQEELDERQEHIAATRSILPLLKELAGYLSVDLVDQGVNEKIYGVLSKAVNTLAAAGMAAGLRWQPQLMQEFHLLLEKLRCGTQCRLPEMPGLIADFLLFLEAVYTCTDQENSTPVLRVKQQLHGLFSLLSMPSQKNSADFQDGGGHLSGEDIFASPDPEGQSMSLLEDFADSLLQEEQVEESELSHLQPPDFTDERFIAPEEPKEVQSEEQQVLMDIFRSECEEHLIVINHSLNSLENEVQEPCAVSAELRETISVMRRAVHTLKGAAAMTGMNLTARGAHALEDLLDWIHDEADEITPDEVQILATGIDVIELLSQSSQEGESLQLDRLVETISSYLQPHTETLPWDEVSALEETTLRRDVVGEEASDLHIDTVPVAGQEIEANLPGTSGIVRVRLDDLDELVGIEGELVVARGAMEKMLEEFSDTLFELDTVKENLRRKSQELEAGFEVQSLYGFSPRQGDETVGGDFSEFDPIELDRYSQLNLIIRSLNEISVDVNSIHATLMSLVGDFGGQVGKQQLTMRLMQEKLMRIRMTPMSSLSRMLFRTVRETARKLDKKASLVIIGEDVYMDRYVWTKITDPLMHMLRNALDHGIESPAERIAAGKPESGTIRLEADQRSRFVILRISDDGRGIDMARVKERIRSGGLAADADQLSEKELLEFLFHPSFTTRQDVGTISGRGIGLDVVRKNIQDLRGSVQLFTMPNQGVTFEIRIPFTLSVNRAVMVSVAGRIFAVPLQDIQQVKRFAAEEVIADDGVFLRHGDMVIPVVNLGYCLQLEKLMTARANPREGILAVLFYKEEKLCAVSIDEVVEQREIIVKSLGSHLTHVPGISGVTLTGYGELIPIVNLRELMDQQKPVAARGIEPASQAGLTEPLRVLIVDDSISVRHSVARLVEGQGWKQQQAVDGSDALVKLETFVPDVIILDIEMPKMNGYELKSTLNNDPALKDIPVVMLTSRSSEKHQQKAKELGVRHYMTKPYQEEAFIRMLESIQNRSIN